MEVTAIDLIEHTTFTSTIPVWLKVISRMVLSEWIGVSDDLARLRLEIGEDTSIDAA